MTSDRDGSVVTAVTVALDVVATCDFCRVFTNSTFIWPFAPPPVGFVHRNCCGLKLNLAPVDCVDATPPPGFMSILVGTSEIFLPATVEDVVVVDAPLLTAIGVAKIILVVVLTAATALLVVGMTLAIDIPLSSSGNGEDAGDDLISNICGKSSLAAAPMAAVVVFGLVAMAAVATFDPFNAELLVNCR